MENVKTKKKYPSLPSNYVSISDLKQRWLNQKQQKEEAEHKIEIEENEEVEETERHRFQDLQKQQQQQRDEPVAMVRTRSSTGILNTKRMRKKRNGKVVEKGKEISEESEFSEANKCTIESGLNEVEKYVKQNPKVEEGEKKENEVMAESESSEAKKSTDETELNEEKKHDSIEDKFGGLSVNSVNGKQGWKIKRVNNGFGHYHPVTTNEYYFGGSRYGFSGRYGGQNRHNDKRNKVVWVKKGDNCYNDKRNKVVGEIEA